MEAEITTVYTPNEIDEAKKSLMEIRFDCLVKMYDYGSIGKKGRLPQWFKLQEHFTLEFIKYSNEYQIGSAIKQAYLKLEEHINNYEKSHQ